MIRTTVPTLLDRILYDATNTIPGSWAVDVDTDTGEPLRVRHDGNPAVGVASYIKNFDAIVSSGRRGKSAEKALRKAREAYTQHQSDRARWGMGS